MGKDEAYFCFCGVAASLILSLFTNLTRICTKTLFAFAFALNGCVSIVEGLRVLNEISQPDPTVLRPLRKITELLIG